METSTNLFYKSLNWYLYDKDLRHQRVNSEKATLNRKQLTWFISHHKLVPPPTARSF